jgi:serine O-acetyltransferase
VELTPAPRASVAQIMFQMIAQDLARCGGDRIQRLRETLSNPGMWAVIEYRYRRWAHGSRLPWPLRRLMNLCGIVSELWIKIVANIELPTTAQIGPGLYIPHTGTIVVSSRARIGSNCTIAHGVTIGHGGGGNKSSNTCPVIGDRVYLGPSSAVVGPIEVGDDALIGVGAIVIRSVPAGGVAVGNPARVISRRGSFDLIQYRGMDADPIRAAALAGRRPQAQEPAKLHPSVRSDLNAVCIGS